MSRNLIEAPGAFPVGVGFKLREFYDWVDWMKRDLAGSGVDLPSEEMCVLFAASSVRLADGIQRIYSHVPASVRSMLIQAAILHQCWTRQVKFRPKDNPFGSLAAGLTSA